MDAAAHTVNAVMKNPAKMVHVLIRLANRPVERTIVVTMVVAVHAVNVMGTKSARKANALLWNFANHNAMAKPAATTAAAAFAALVVPVRTAFPANVSTPRMASIPIIISKERIRVLQHHKMEPKIHVAGCSQPFSELLESIAEDVHIDFINARLYRSFQAPIYGERSRLWLRHTPLFFA